MTFSEICISGQIMRLRYCTKMIKVPRVTAPAMILGAVRLITRMMKAT